MSEGRFVSSDTYDRTFRSSVLHVAKRAMSHRQWATMKVLRRCREATFDAWRQYGHQYGLNWMQAHEVWAIFTLEMWVKAMWHSARDEAQFRRHIAMAKGVIDDMESLLPPKDKDPKDPDNRRQS